LSAHAFGQSSFPPMHPTVATVHPRASSRAQKAQKKTPEAAIGHRVRGNLPPPRVHARARAPTRDSTRRILFLPTHPTPIIPHSSPRATASARRCVRGRIHPDARSHRARVIRPRPRSRARGAVTTRWIGTRIFFHARIAIESAPRVRSRTTARRHVWSEDAPPREYARSLEQPVTFAW